MLTDAELTALRLSIQVALAATAINLPFAIAAAWLLARKEFALKPLFDGLIHLPLILPPVVVGYALLLLFGRNGPIGGWLHDSFGLSLVFSWIGAAIAAAVMAFPLVVRAIRLSMEATDPRLEEAARSLGVGSFTVFRRVLLPLSFPGILAGAVLGLARCLGEFGATITFAANIPGLTQTLPLALYAELQKPGGEVAAGRLALLSVAIAIIALAVSYWLERRRKPGRAGTRR